MASTRELLDRLEHFGTRLGLERMRKVLTGLGEPQSGMTVVLVAGTNGKGSTAALLASITTAAGYRTGLYTSPHLESVLERVRVDGASVSDPELAACLEEVLEAAARADEEECTYFEALTGAALVQFGRAAVELAVLEVGLGGRLDATNATEPALSLITEIGLDHGRYLGDTVEQVAIEKAGILRSGTPALAWVTDPAARGALGAHARSRGVPLRFVIDECSVRRHPEGERVELATAAAAYELVSPLAGAHQAANLALAVSAAEALAAAGWSRLDAGAIRSGVAGCRWPGRLEWVELGERGRVLLDGAHNPHACRALAGHLAGLEPGYTLVFGALDDKDASGMLPPVAERAGRIVLTAPRSPRASDPHELAPLLAGRECEVIEEAAQALAAALSAPGPVVVTGSLYLVGEMRTELRRRFGRPPRADRVATYSAP